MRISDVVRTTGKQAAILWVSVFDSAGSTVKGQQCLGI